MSDRLRHRVHDRGVRARGTETGRPRKIEIEPYDDVWLRGRGIGADEGFACRSSRCSERNILVARHDRPHENRILDAIVVQRQ